MSNFHPNHPIDNTYNLVNEQYRKSMMALQLMDPNASEKALMIAQNAYRALESQAQYKDSSDLPKLKVYVNIIEIVTRILRAIYLISDERYEKAKEEEEINMEIIKSTKGSLNDLIHAGIEFEDKDQTFVLKYFYIIISDQNINTKAAIDRRNGKFVNEVEVLKSRIRELKKIDHIPLDVSHEFLDFSIGLINMIKKSIEVHEKTLERLKDKNKRINFLDPIGRDVFLIHGHGKALVKEFRELLEKHLNIQPIILVDESGSGRTIIEQIENYGMRSAFAFSIFTPDDWVKNNGKEYFQTRPNVLFELGWFCGRYGRSKVRIIKQKGTELPSDLSGLITLDFHENIEEVFFRIKRELEEFGLI